MIALDVDAPTDTALIRPDNLATTECHALGAVPLESEWFANLPNGVIQVGGMGILERLNRTFKHAFVFRHKGTTLNLRKSFLGHYTTYIDAALAQLRREGRMVRDEDGARLSPLIHGHIHVLGRYSFLIPESVATGELRPLRNPAQSPD
ncbi:MAG: Tn3 family transposase [Candidatus Competibacteraceae bacterium]|nr:Tn3 family transposase [Candidatus Competibacteraceae bacterium]